MPVRVMSLDLGVSRRDTPIDLGLPCFITIEFPPHCTVPIQIRRSWGVALVTVRAHRYIGLCAERIYVSNDQGIGHVILHYADSPHELPTFTECRQLDEVRRYVSSEYTIIHVDPGGAAEKVSGLDFLTEIEWQTAKEISLILLATVDSPPEVAACFLASLPLTAEQCVISWTLAGFGTTAGSSGLLGEISPSIRGTYGIGGSSYIRTPGTVCDILLVNNSITADATLAFILGVRL